MAQPVMYLDSCLYTLAMLTNTQGKEKKLCVTHLGLPLKLLAFFVFIKFKYKLNIT